MALGKCKIPDYNINREENNIKNIETPCSQVYRKEMIQTPCSQVYRKEMIQRRNDWWPYLFGFRLVTLYNTSIVCSPPTGASWLTALWAKPTEDNNCIFITNRTIALGPFRLYGRNSCVLVFESGPNVSSNSTESRIYDNTCDKTHTHTRDTHTRDTHARVLCTYDTTRLLQAYENAPHPKGFFVAPTDIDAKNWIKDITTAAELAKLLDSKGGGIEFINKYINIPNNIKGNDNNNNKFIRAAVMSPRSSTDSYKNKLKIDRLGRTNTGDTVYEDVLGTPTNDTHTHTHRHTYKFINNSPIIEEGKKELAQCVPETNTHTHTHTHSIMQILI
eukprot:GHVR01049158.1.p1 GENE.GHVR01049158.1~~GHVR01049158.1.p1  ORF type:complete len:332 (+),score=130.14 GHVR01049158.1:145-1140(+)